MLLVGPEVVTHVNAFDNENPVLFFNVARYISRQQSAACRNPARLQRAAKGPGKSAARGGDDIVECGGMFDTRFHAIVPRDGAVYAEIDRSRVTRHPCVAMRPLETFYSDLRLVNGF